MKKFILAISILMSAFVASYALTTTMTDIWAVGSDGSGGPLVRIDSSGNVYCTDLTASDALNVTGTVTFSGESNFDEQVDVDLDARDEEFNITTSSVSTVGTGVLQVYNTSTSPTEQHYLLDLWQKNQGTDVDGDFIICRDSSTSHTVFTVSEDGNTAINGTLAVTGAATITGTTNVTRVAATNSTYAVSIASAATSTAKMYFGGAFASLPTTGFSAGSIIYNSADTFVYVSTETVSGTYSWIKIGAQ